MKKRKNLPQLKKINNQNIKKIEKADPKTLTPIQDPKDYSGLKFEKFVNKFLTNPKKVKPPVVSRDNFVIDGHHRWLAALTLNKNINILRLNKSKKEYLQMKKSASVFGKTENLFNIIKPEKLIRPERLKPGKSNIKNYISKRPTAVSIKE